MTLMNIHELSGHMTCTHDVDEHEKYSKVEAVT